MVGLRAYISTGIDYPYMVTLDASGALWVAHYYGELVKLDDPTTYSGSADVSGDLALQLTWISGSGYPDGGTIEFVPR